MIQINKTILDEKESNQKSLFGGTTGEKITNFSLEKTEPWSSNEMLLNEFQSIGFYMSDHPLNMYKDYFKKSKVVTFNEFMEGPNNNALVAGTIMSIQEKKSSKGTAFAIVKFSDLKSEFELFLFSDLLILNRDKLKTANSFVLTLQKESALDNNNSPRRVNVRNIIALDDFSKKKYENVRILCSCSGAYNIYV